MCQTHTHTHTTSTVHANARRVWSAITINIMKLHIAQQELMKHKIISLKNCMRCGGILEIMCMCLCALLYLCLPFKNYYVHSLSVALRNEGNFFRNGVNSIIMCCDLFLLSLARACPKLFTSGSHSRISAVLRVFNVCINTSMSTEQSPFV